MSISVFDVWISLCEDHEFHVFLVWLWRYKRMAVTVFGHNLSEVVSHGVF
jgi:hypothetical protein